MEDKKDKKCRCEAFTNLSKQFLFFLWLKKKNFQIWFVVSVIYNM